MRSIRDLELAGRAVLVRCDLDVPMRGDEIVDDAPIRAATRTIRFALEAGARVAVAAHLGARGRGGGEATLEPVGARLSELLELDVLLSQDCTGDGVRRLVSEMRSDNLLLLENLALCGGEEKNDAGFARELAAPFEVYVNDAFAASLHACASTVGVPRYLVEHVAGLLLEEEVAALGKLRQSPARPFVAVVGGGGLSPRLGLLNALIGRVDSFCVGGATAYTLLRARGEEVGGSRAETGRLRAARELMERAVAHGLELSLPHDHVGGATFTESATPQLVAATALPPGTIGLDIGPHTRALYAERVRAAGSVLWCGALGVAEWERFAAGTQAIAEAVTEGSGYSVVVGDQACAAVRRTGKVARVGHLATSGAASLAFLEHGTLPGIQALEGP